MIRRNPANSNLWSYNYLQDTLLRVDDIAELHKDPLKNFHGRSLRAENPLTKFYPRRTKYLRAKAYREILKLFTTSFNASIAWISPESPSPDLSWFIDNKVDLVLYVPYTSAYSASSVVEHQFYGVCILVPEQTIGPYVHHLLKPLRSSLVTEAGLWSLWIEWQSRELPVNQELVQQMLTFRELASIWWLLAWGAGLGGAALLLEIVAFHWMRVGKFASMVLEVFFGE
ncbi:hypothetical protein pipiens_016147 [Culex pipiens pipiens]|uniref:Ionotropic receptor n=1 Tax=Culex pipiens pipiens TaxID=38569 RepID=A0ABD1CMM0_CULPP